jgi:hypothetical protein
MALFGIYQWCLDSIRNEDFQATANTLTELRDAWASAEQQLGIE